MKPRPRLALGMLLLLVCLLAGGMLTGLLVLDSSRSPLPLPTNLTTQVPKVGETGAAPIPPPPTRGPTHSPLTTPATQVLSSTPSWADPIQQRVVAQRLNSLPAVLAVQHYTVVDTVHIWIILETGLWATQDGGQHWQQQMTGQIDDVRFVDAQHGWLAQGRTIYMTQDGGHTWRVQHTMPPPTTVVENPAWAKRYPVLDLDFITPQQGWVTDGATLWTTHDGGQTWQPLVTDGSISAVEFADARHGWGWTGCGACEPTLWHTRTGGQTWERGTVPGCGWYKAGGLFSFPGSETGWAVCIPSNPYWIDPQLLHHTTDGGQTWAVIPSTEPGQGVGPEAVTDLFFSPDQRGWVSISHGTSVMDPAWLLRATASGGQTWQTLATGHEYLTQLHFLSSQRGYATLGNSGALLTTADGGRTWQRIYGNPPVPHTLFFFDTRYGVGVGLAEDAGRVLHTTDGGRQWQAGVSLAPACGAAGVLAVEALQFVDRQTGTLQVICGNAGAAPDAGISLGTNDGGTTWQARPAPVRTIPPGSPTPLPSTVGWYVDLYSNLVPGAVPQLPPATASAWHLPITVYPDGQPWYAGTRDPRSPSSGALLQTRDAGATWQRYDLWTAPRSLAFVDAQHGWLQDWQRQHLYWTADGGAHWEQVR